MMAPNENPLAPASLGTGGAKGAEALGPCGSQGNAQPIAAHYLARVAVQAAQAQLNRYALATDDPAPGLVEAADLLDAASDCLVPVAEFSDAIKGARGGDA